MSLSSTIEQRQGPRLVSVPLEDINETNAAYAAVMNDRERLLETIDGLRHTILEVEEDNRILTQRVESLDTIIDELKDELFDRNDALSAIRTTLESQAIDF